MDKLPASQLALPQVWLLSHTRPGHVSWWTLAGQLWVVDSSVIQYIGNQAGCLGLWICIRDM